MRTHSPSPIGAAARPSPGRSKWTGRPGVGHATRGPRPTNHAQWVRSHTSDSPWRGPSARKRSTVAPSGTRLSSGPGGSSAARTPATYSAGATSARSRSVSRGPASARTEPRSRRRRPKAGTCSSQSLSPSRSPGRRSTDPAGPTNEPRGPATGASPRLRARTRRGARAPKSATRTAPSRAGSTAPRRGADEPPSRNRARARAARRPVPSGRRARNARPAGSTATAHPDVASARPSSAGTVPVFAWKPRPARPFAVPPRAESRSPASTSRRTASPRSHGSRTRPT